MTILIFWIGFSIAVGIAANWFLVALVYLASAGRGVSIRTPGG